MMKNALNKFEGDYKKLPDFDKNLIPSMNPLAAGLIGLISVFVLYQIVGGLLTLLVFGFDIKNVDKNSLRLMTMAGQILFILLPALMFTRAVYGDISTILRVRRIPKLKEFLLGILGLALITPLLQLMIYLQNYTLSELSTVSSIFETIKNALDQLDKLVESSYLDILTSSSVFETFLVVIVVTITPAICEETFFRGFVQKSFELKMRPFWAILITSIFFGFYHFNPYGMLSLVFLSFYLGYVAYKSRSILLPFLLHFLNNLFAVIMFLIYGEEELVSAPDLSQIDLATSLLQFGFLSFFFIVFLIYYRNHYKKLEES